MHDGTKAYDGVKEVVGKLVAAGKTLVILSNSGKRRDNSAKMLNKLCFHADDFSQIITSGEVAYHLLSGTEDSIGCKPWSHLPEEPKNAFVLGSGDGDKEYCESSGWKVSSLDDASFIVARGTFTVQGGGVLVNKDDDEKAYDQALADCMKSASARQLPSGCKSR